MRKEFRLELKEMEQLLSLAKLTLDPEATTEKLLAFWNGVAKKNKFHPSSVVPSDRGSLYFFAITLDEEDQGKTKKLSETLKDRPVVGVDIIEDDPDQEARPVERTDHTPPLKKPRK